MDIEIISAPSILGLVSQGVDKLGSSLLDAGLALKLRTRHPVKHVPTLNTLYNKQRDKNTNCLNPQLIRDFSIVLNEVITGSIKRDHFPLVLGGDCSILLGTLPALKEKGTYGLIFIDAHSDFYAPEQSTNGEVADMDLAIVTGRGPEILTNIKGLQPYVKDENVIHIGQRDQEEAKKFGVQDIVETAITCYNLEDIKQQGIDQIIPAVMKHMDTLDTAGYWLHFDTDVLSDDINPAVDYRLPDGLLFRQVEKMIGSLLSTQKITGMSVTIFNPALDKDGSIAKGITTCIARAFETVLP